MKLHTVPISMTVTVGVASAAFAGMAVYSALVQHNRDMTVSATALAFMLFLILFHDVIAFSERGITIRRWAREIYTLPWHEVQMVGMVEGIREMRIAYFSRYDAEGTASLLSQMIQFMDPEMMPFTLNYVLSSRNRERMDRAPIFVINSMQGSDYEKARWYWYRYRAIENSVEAEKKEEKTDA